MKRQVLIIILTLYLVMILGEGRAHAYIDPTSGSMLLQLLLGGVAGIGLALKLFWRQILLFFHIKPREKSEDQKKP